ncbi:MAG: adenylate/guanylate cyclase domain-containing protein, partial [bacterium]
ILIAAFLTGPIRRLQTAVQAIAAGDFGQRVAGRLQRDEIGDLTEAFNDMAQGLAERETMRGAFASYVSKDLLEEIIRNPDVMKPGGTRKIATIMFAYFGNHEELPFLAQQLAPEIFVRIVNDYLEVEAKLIVEHGGYPDKFIGDGVMAVWGVPLETPDHAERAVRCAVAIQQTVLALNEERAKAARVCTEISIGINTGPVVVGSMGSEGRKLDYTVISEDVNFAARLAGAGAFFHGGQIWIGPRTHEMVKGMAEVKSLGEIEFKGLGPRPVWEVAGLRPASVAAAR